MLTLHPEPRNVVIGILFFLVLVIPTLLVGTSFYQQVNTTLTDQVYTQRITVAALSASAMNLKLTELSSLAVRGAQNGALVTSVKAHDWTGAKAAIIALGDDPDYFDYYIDRMLVLDASGTVMTAYPAIGQAGIGVTDDAYAEWYGPIVQQDQPSYVSNVYTRSVDPRTNLVEIVAPVKDGGRIAGFFELTIPINEFSDFGKDADPGSSGFAYFVDRLGHIVTHPKYASDGPIIDYSAGPSIQAVMKGESGTSIGYNPLERQQRVVAYQPVPGFGWGVIAQEPAADAFSSRDTILQNIMAMVIAFGIIELIAAFALFIFLGKPRRGKERGRQRRGFTLIELLVVVGIIAILSIVVVLVINPAELLRQSRDSSRVSDLSTLRTALSLYLSTASNLNLASSSFGYSACYLSTLSGNGTTTANCGIFLNTGAGGNASTTSSTYRNINSTGWVPVDFSKIGFGTPFGNLPIDPSNNVTNYYAYAATAAGSYELGTFIESSKYGKGGSAAVVVTGTIYEIGSSLSL